MVKIEHKIVITYFCESSWKFKDQGQNFILMNPVKNSSSETYILIAKFINFHHHIIKKEKNVVGEFPLLSIFILKFGRLWDRFRNNWASKYINNDFFQHASNFLVEYLDKYWVLF